MEIIKNMISGVGSAAMILAMTKTVADEQSVKEYLQRQSYKIAVTEVGGNTVRGAFQEKAVKAIVGAGLNNDVISKDAHEIHAILHAAMEAQTGIILNVAASTNISAKIAIARQGEWIAAAIFAESALYHMTNHERAGLGVMHI